MAQQQALAPHASTAHTRVDPVRVWLFAVAALVFVMVSVGGATRLTGSGLSITEWQPIMGAIPPLSDAAWQEALEKYRQIPQYQHVNKGMSLEAFKRIFWWEWSHRFLARFVGVAFLVPFLFFLATGRIARPLVPKLAGLFALGGLQGVIGWYMVSFGPRRADHVSQYRLAVHLSLAIVIFAGLLWIALSLGDRARPEATACRRSIAESAAWIVGLVFLQIVAGAFVAGLKAGNGYNTWPLMDGRFIPQGLGAMSPWWANLFENATTVQFNHRMLAYVLVAVVLWHVWSLLARADDRPVRMSAMALAVRGAGAGRARHLDAACASAAVAGPAASGWRRHGVRHGAVAPAHPAAGLTQSVDRLWQGVASALPCGPRTIRSDDRPPTHNPTADRVPDAPPGNWVDRLAPPSWKPYLRLARFDRPIGAWLLLFPAWWSQALAEVSLGRPYPNLWYLALFWLGAFVMRGAGCTYNDIVDRDYDARVARTAARPIPSGQVTVTQAYLFLAVLCAAGLLVLVQFNLFTIVLGASSLLLIAIYPFMKRVTFWPQLVLGLTFKWGALVGWAAITGSLSLGRRRALCRVGAVDRSATTPSMPTRTRRTTRSWASSRPRSDSAQATPRWLVLFYTGAVVLWGAAGMLAGAHARFRVALALAAAQMAWQVVTLDTSDAGNCLARFKSNRLVGWLLFGGLVADMAISALSSRQGAAPCRIQVHAAS